MPAVLAVMGAMFALAIVIYGLVHLYALLTTRDVRMLLYHWGREVGAAQHEAGYREFKKKADRQHTERKYRQRYNRDGM